MAERELVHQIVIRASIEEVWQELTRLDGRQRAMMDTVLDSTMQVGDPLYYKTADGERVFIVGRILDIDPPTRLSHTQQLLMRDDPWTVVTWDLTEVDGGTQVTLRHTGWPEETPKLDSVDKTWAMILPELKRLLEDGDISTGLKLKYAFMRTFLWTLPSRTKPENVPEPPNGGGKDG